jgi:tetratricopeptide (TPR) repeat protein
VLGRAVAWQAGLAFFWTCLLAACAAIGAHTHSRMWGYLLSGGMGAFVGLLYGSLNPAAVRREDAWLMTALPLAPLSALLATFLLRNVLVPGSIGSTAAAGALAGGMLMLPMGALLAWLWDEAHGLRQMGLLYLHNENFAPKAIAYFDRAIALAPRDAELYNLRGIAWSKMDEPARAAADWLTVTELLPNDPEPHLNRGVDFLRQGALDPAIEALHHALAIQPDHSTAHSNLGACYERRGDLDQAIEHYGRAIAQRPDYANAYSNRGYAYWKKGEHERALEDCNQAITLAPGLGMAHVNRGHALAGLGRSADAEASYREAMELDVDPTVREEAIRGLETVARGSCDDQPV